MRNARARVGPAIATLLASIAAAGCHSKPPSDLNVLVITLDTTRADRLPPYGFAGVQTPI